MIFKPLPLEGAHLIQLKKFSDERGFFARSFCKDEFEQAGLESDWVQVNNSLSRKKGTLRGLHFQRPPQSEVKMVRCIKGAIWDVIVDIRKGSKTYGEWVGAELNEENRDMMYVPKGFAHGFISLTEDSEILYMVSARYNPDLEGTLRWNDPFHGIEWPMAPQILSEKDQNATDWNESKSISL
tara:strand:+ start:1248 stop:1796 length:549 start_codon:yes stop_codon:yes gene_type:complete